MKPLTFFEDDIFQWQHYLPNSIIIWVMEFQAASKENLNTTKTYTAELHCIGSVKKVAPHQLGKHTDKKIIRQIKVSCIQIMC